MTFRVFNPLTGDNVLCADEQAVVTAVAEIQRAILNQYQINIVDEIVNASGDATWIASQLVIPNINLTVTTNIPVTKI